MAADTSIEAPLNGSETSQKTRIPYPSSPRPHFSPSMNPSYSSYPPSAPGQAKSEQHHTIPAGSNASLPAINLPPIRIVEGQGQLPSTHQPSPAPQHQSSQPASAQHQTMAAGPPLPPSVMPSTYYSQHAPGMQAPAHFSYSGAQFVSMQDQRIMSGGRHKKEIKRRTKTGCMTCRKRRIKCDEGHPTCRNCEKSKRQCLGYDPMFKPQSTSNLQPSSSTSPATSHSQPSPGNPTPSAPAHPHVSPGLNPSSGTLYAQVPGQIIRAAPGPYDAGKPIDLVLGTPDMLQAGRNGSTGDLSSAASATRKNLSIDELYVVKGVPPPGRGELVPKLLTQATENEVKLIYQRDYAPGLDRLLETQWFSQRSMSKLLLDGPLVELFDQMLDRWKNTKGNDHQGLQAIQSLETKVIWNLMTLPRSPTAATNGVTDAASKEETLELVEVQRRINALEALLTHTTLERNPCLDIPYGETLLGAKYWEVEFWRLLGHSVTLPIQHSASEGAIQQSSRGAGPEETLQACRLVLSMLENRDVLYSAMVCRIIGPRLPDFPQGVRAAHNNDDNDPRTKVFVAKTFLENEASGKGTNQVIQRICDMFVCSWTAGR